jgi:Transposase DDE domain
MKNKLMPLIDKILLRKRAIVETIIDQLKNISQLEHTRHRSPVNFMVNAVCSLIAYSHFVLPLLGGTRKEKKPSLNIRSNELGNLPVVM